MCAEIGTARGDGEVGGATSTVIAATTFFTLPVQDAVTSPEADPAISILFSGRPAVEMASAICPICIRSSCTLAVPLRGGGFLAPEGMLQFVIWSSPCALPPNTRVENRGNAIFSGVMEKGKAASTPEARQEASRHSAPRTSAVPSVL